jgi:DNA repair protein RadC
VASQNKLEQYRAKNIRIEINLYIYNKRHKMENTKLYELRKNQTDFPKMKIQDANDSAEFIKQFYQGDIEIYESFFLLLLNNANQTIGYAKISQGGVTSTIVDVKIIAKYVVDSLATGIILAHNHPSGNLTPSSADIAITKKVKEAMKFFDVTVLDHIILTADGFYSFNINGLM